MKSLPKICVVGAGYWGENHINTLHDLGLLGGIVEQKAKRLKQFKEKYPEAITYQNLNDALDSNEFAGFTVSILALEADWAKNTLENRNEMLEVIHEELEKKGVADIMINGQSN